MATKFSVQFEGFREFSELAKEIQNDFGEKDAKNIMVNAARASMRSALLSAQSRAPVDTGALRKSLQIEARKPRNKDKSSRYVLDGDVAIALITTASGKKLAKTKFVNQRTGEKQTGITSDARATVMEFGSAKTPAQPYLRPAVNDNMNYIVAKYEDNIKDNIKKYNLD